MDSETKIERQKVERVLAELIRYHDVDPGAIESAVTSAVNMTIGQAVALTGVNEPLRRVFVQTQAKRLAE